MTEPTIEALVEANWPAVLKLEGAPAAAAGTVPSGFAWRVDGEVTAAVLLERMRSFNERRAEEIYASLIPPPETGQDPAAAAALLTAVGNDLSAAPPSRVHLHCPAESDKLCRRLVGIGFDLLERLDIHEAPLPLARPASAPAPPSTRRRELRCEEITGPLEPDLDRALEALHNRAFRRLPGVPRWRPPPAPMRTLVARVDDKPAGFLLWAPLDGAGYVDSIVVERRFWRTGAANRLCALFSELAVADGLTRARAAVGVGNHPSLGLVRRHGFEKASELWHLGRDHGGAGARS